MSSVRKHRGAVYREYRPYFIQRSDGERLKDWTVRPFEWSPIGYPFTSRQDAEEVINRWFVGMATARMRGYRIVRP